MKAIILTLLFSAVLGAKTVFFRTSKEHDRNEILQHEEQFATQFYEKFRQEAICVTALTLGNYEPKEIEHPAKHFEDFLLKKTRLKKMLKKVLPKTLKTSREIVPVFKVDYDGNEIEADTKIVHNGLEYEVANCSICLSFCEDPKNVCNNKHSFCNYCLDEIEKFKTIKSCPNCRDELQEHLQWIRGFPMVLGKVLIRLFLAVVAYLPYYLDFNFMGSGFSNALGFAFQTYATFLASVGVVPMYRHFRGQKMETIDDVKKIVKVILVVMISNICLGISTIGGWTTFSGFLLSLALPFILNRFWAIKILVVTVVFGSIVYA